MGGKTDGEAGPADDRTTVTRSSSRDLVVARTFDAPACLVYEAWTRPELFVRWWTPKSSGLTLLSCDMDVRVGGGYRIAFGHPRSDSPAVFHGKYVEVAPNARLSWTNEESDAGPLTTVTFEERDGRTHLVLHERYPTERALDDSLEGMEGGMPEQFQQLDALLVSLAA